MWLLQIPKKGKAGAVGHLPGWCSHTKEPHTARPGLKLPSLVAPALPAAGKPQRRQKNSQLAADWLLLVNWGNWFWREHYTLGCLQICQDTKHFWEFMFLQNNVVFPCALCFLMWKCIRKTFKSKNHIWKSCDTKKFWLFIFSHFCTLLLCLPHCSVNSFLWKSLVKTEKISVFSRSSGNWCSTWWEYRVKRNGLYLVLTMFSDVFVKFI